MFVPPSILAETLPDLERFGRDVLSKQVMDWITDSEIHPPYIRGSGYNSLGRRTDELVTSEGWRRLQDMGFAEG